MITTLSNKEIADIIIRQFSLDLFTAENIEDYGESSVGIFQSEVSEESKNNTQPLFVVYYNEKTGKFTFDLENVFPGCFYNPPLHDMYSSQRPE